MRSGFFNSNISGYDEYGNPIYDRAEEASFFASFFAAFLSNGVYPNPSTGMQALENSKLGVLVSEGKCFINGYFGVVEPGGEEVVFETADTTLPRIDRIVARWDLQKRDINLHVLKGVAASSPVAPELTRNSNIYELCLADIKIAANATVITQANITDTRLDTNICGLVTGVVDQVDTATIFNQYQAALIENISANQEEFDYWFNNVKEILSEDAAGNLLDLIKNKTTINRAVVVTSKEIAENTDYTIPLNYIVGDNSLEIYYMGEKLVKDEHYIEVGDEGSVSNIIQFYDWGQSVPVDRLIEFVVRGVV